MAYKNFSKKKKHVDPFAEVLDNIDSQSKKKASNDERYSDADDDIINDFKSVINSQAGTPYNLIYHYVNDENSKIMVELKKNTPLIKFITKADIIVIFNSDFYDKMDEESRQILFEQELAKVHQNLDSGKVEVTKPDVNTFSGIISKYGLDKVARANKLVSLISEQQNDNNSDMNKNKEPIFLI